jgi:hypothetical protein
VIERIERLYLGNATPSQSMEKPRPSQKVPKWLIKTLKIVCLDKFGKTCTRSSIRQDDGGDVNYMDVSYDCELNLSTNFEPTSFEESTSHDEWKEAT